MARGMGHVIKQYQLAQAGVARNGSTTIAGPWLGGVRVAASLSIDMPLAEYDRRFDRRYARAVRELLHEFTRERATRTGLLPKKAFREVYDALQNRFKLGEYGAAYLLADAWMRNARPSSLEDALAFLNGFMTRAALDAVPEKERFQAAWRIWDNFLQLFCGHVQCIGLGNLKPATLLLSLDLWKSTDLSVAPCHAMRVMHLAARGGLDTGVVSAFAREHGAERLDDIARLIEDQVLTAETVWELQTRPDLVRALAHRQIDWLVRAWRKGPATDLLAFAQDSRRELRRLRGPNAPGTRPSPIIFDTTAGAISWAFREATPTERAVNDLAYVLRVHDTACGRETYRPGSHVPADDAILGSAFECSSELSTGLGRRLSLAGDALDAQAERVCRLVAGGASDSRTMFALDLLCEWDGTVSPDLCVRAANAAARAHIPDSLALDLLRTFGRNHVEEAVGLIEDGLMGLKECQRLLRNPVLVIEFRGRMRDLLERYRSANSPADIYALAHRRPGSTAPQWPKPERTGPAARIVLRNDTALNDPTCYLAALDAAESRPRDIVVTPDTEPIPEARAEEPAPAVAPSEAPTEESAAERPAPVTLTRETPADGPLLRLMREIGDDPATVAVARAWDGLVSLFPRNKSAEIAEALEPILARMVRAESREQSKKKVPREDCYNNVIYGTFFGHDDGVDDMALSVLLSFEKTGLAFPTRQEFRAFYLGISARVGHTAGDRTVYGEAHRMCGLLCKHLLVHLPHLSDDDRAAVIQSAEALLMGIDLFTEAGGNAPMCKCLRIAVGLRRRMVPREESFWLFRMFTAERADDLIAVLENRRVPTRNIDRLYQRPETVAERALDDLVNLLAA